MTREEFGYWAFEPIECPLCEEVKKGFVFYDDCDWKSEGDFRHCPDCKDAMIESIKNDSDFSPDDKSDVILDLSIMWGRKLEEQKGQ